MPNDDNSLAGFAAEQVLWLARALGFVAPPAPKPRLPAAKKVIGSSQRDRADALLKKLSAKDQKRYDAVVKQAKSDEERDYVTKALAASHSVSEIEAFAKKIKGKDAAWMQNNLKLTGSTSGTGVKQQWSHSCNATTVQAVQAELDPIYALKLHEQNPDVTTANEASGTKANPKLAAEQKQMLESKYKGGVAGAVGSKGKAAARDQGAKGSGRWGDDLLNARSKTTGLKYTTTFLDATYTMDKATKDLDKALAKGQPVPIVIGDGAASASAHYVLVTQMDEGPPKEYTIHDPWDGVTVTRSADDLVKGKINLAGWNKMSSMELPSECK
jgi:hypothetical protein